MQDSNLIVKKYTELCIQCKNITYSVSGLVKNLFFDFNINKTRNECLGTKRFDKSRNVKIFGNFKRTPPNCWMIKNEISDMVIVFILNCI